MEMLENVGIVLAVCGIIIIFALIILVVNTYKKAKQGEALVRTGMGDTKVSFSALFVWPVLHKLEMMDISLKTVMISRTGKDGLICKDNMRADIKVTFFVRVNKTVDDVIQVAQTIGCERASSQDALENLFDAKFSEALKTVGKRFDFVELYNSRDLFKAEILQIIGTDLNGYILDDCAIDYLEQTPLQYLSEHNILDSEGIKKIIDLTAQQKIQSNLIERDKEKTIKKQDVEAREAILELERQLAEKEENQRRAIASVKAREESETHVVQQQERLKAEKAKIATEEELLVAIENKYRQVIVAEKNKERTRAVENERVEKDRLLEVTERDRVVTLADIAKERAIEEERKNIQEVIRERVAVQKSVVEEEERIKDTHAFAEASRNKSVAITKAEMDAEQALVAEIKAAEAAKQASESKAKQKLIEADAEQAAAIKQADAIKVLAEAEAAQAAAHGLAEARVMEAKAAAHEKEGDAEAAVILAKAKAQAEADQKIGNVAASVNREKGLSEANVIEAKASAEEKRGLAEANVLHEKMAAEAKGIQEKAEAMKALDGVGKDHEEFKLRLEKDKTIDLASIDVHRLIAEAQAKVIAEALKTAKIDIVGGESTFFDKITGAITRGKGIDRLFNNSATLTEVKNHVVNGSNGHGLPTNIGENIRSLVGQFGLDSSDVKNLSIAALLLKLSGLTDDHKMKDTLNHLLGAAQKAGMDNHIVETLL